MKGKLISTIKSQSISLNSVRHSLFFREFVLFAISSILYQGSRFVVSLGAAKILGPTTYGFWNMLNLILLYRGVIHVGVIPAMNRDVPLFKGKGDFRKIEEIRRVSLGFISVSAFVVCAATIIAALFIQNPTLRASLQFMALLLLCTQVYHYLQIYLKSDKRFTQMSYQQFLFAGILPVAAISLAVVYGLPGFILGQSLAILVTSFFIVRIIPLRLRPKVDTQELLRLIKVGFPIMAVGLLYGLLTTTDRWVITSFLGMEQLGYYSLTIIVMGLLQLIPGVVAEQIYPRMAETFGSTSNYSSLKRWIVRQITMAMAITVPLLIGVYFFLPPLVRTFLPDYGPGIAAMKIILIGFLFLPFSGGFGNFLNTVNKQVYYMAVLGFAVLINLGLNVTFVKLGLGINGVALGTAIAYIIYTLTLAAIVRKILSGAE